MCQVMDFNAYICRHRNPWLSKSCIFSVLQKWMFHWIRKLDLKKTNIFNIIVELHRQVSIFKKHFLGKNFVCLIAVCLILAYQSVKYILSRGGNCPIFDINNCELMTTRMRNTQMVCLFLIQSSDILSDFRVNVK